ncbi:hypothetical protein TSUD_236630 [Trifolium subterraneum]|nr:hypothetical protein TSUD_236630 [Trifolium subterraneum]
MLIQISMPYILEALAHDVINTRLAAFKLLEFVVTFNPLCLIIQSYGDLLCLDDLLDDQDTFSDKLSGLNRCLHASDDRLLSYCDLSHTIEAIKYLVDVSVYQFGQLFEDSDRNGWFTNDKFTPMLSFLKIIGLCLQCFKKSDGATTYMDDLLHDKETLNDTLVAHGVINARLTAFKLLELVVSFHPLFLPSDFDWIIQSYVDLLSLDDLLDDRDTLSDTPRGLTRCLHASDDRLLSYCDLPHTIGAIEYLVDVSLDLFGQLFEDSVRNEMFTKDEFAPMLSFLKIIGICSLCLKKSDEATTYMDDLLHDKETLNDTPGGLTRCLLLLP